MSSVSECNARLCYKTNYSFSVFVFIVAVSVYLKLKNASKSPIPVDVDMSSHVISQGRQTDFAFTNTRHSVLRLLGKETGRPRLTPFLKVRAEVFVVHDNRLK